MIKGDHNKIYGNNNIISGDYNEVNGNSNIIKGDYNEVDGDNNQTKGDFNKNKGNFNTKKTNGGSTNYSGISNVHTNGNVNIGNISVSAINNNDKKKEKKEEYVGISNVYSSGNITIDGVKCWPGNYGIVNSNIQIGCNNVISEGANVSIGNIKVGGFFGGPFSEGNNISKSDIKIVNVNNDVGKSNVVIINTNNNVNNNNDNVKSNINVSGNKIKVPKAEPDEKIIDSDNPEEICSTCMQRKIATIVVGCWHRCLCVTCSRTYENKENPQCPICRKVFNQIEKTY
jgi:hypothetical protein